MKMTHQPLRQGKLLCALFIALCISGFATVTALADAPWALEGQAVPLHLDRTDVDRAGSDSNPWAVQLASHSAGDSAYANIIFRPPSHKLRLRNLHTLEAEFRITAGDCGGGSPRFAIGLDQTDNGAVDSHLFIYFGQAPNYTHCAGDWQKTGNLIGLPNTDTRYDLSKLGGSFYDTYDNAIALAGDARIVYVLLVVDGSWAFMDGQEVLVSHMQVNHHHMTGRNAKHLFEHIAPPYMPGKATALVPKRLNRTDKDLPDFQGKPVQVSIEHTERGKPVIRIEVDGQVKAEINDDKDAKEEKKHEEEKDKKKEKKAKNNQGKGQGKGNNRR